MARPAFVVVAHKTPPQIIHLVRTLLDGADAPVVVHVDAKHPEVLREIRAGLGPAPGLEIISRRRVHWGDISQVDAILDCLAVLVGGTAEFTHVKLLTGQDHPVRPLGEFAEFLAAHPGKSFMEYEPLPNRYWIIGGEADGGFGRVAHPRLRLGGRRVKLPIRRRLPSGMRFAGGSALCCFDRRHAEYVVAHHRRYRALFRFAALPDEMFFQTMLANSEHADDVVNDNLTYTAWEEVSAHPKILGPADFDDIARSGRFFARKFDIAADAAYTAHFGRTAG
jgi:hypothetical protein